MSIACPRSLRERWPDPLAEEWLEQYPQLFDAEDLRMTRTQPTLHFWEWFAAIHILERDGAYSLVEKYVYKNHKRKLARVAEVMTADQEAALLRICDGVEPPDLFVYRPGTHEFWFAEAKGPTDRLRPNQAASHRAIERELGVPVEVLYFKLAKDGLA